MSSRFFDSLTFGPYRRRRAMMRRLRELDRLDAGLKPRSADAKGRPVLAAFAAIGIFGLGGWWILTEELGLDVSASGIGRPDPLGTPPPAPRGEGGFVFARVQPLDPNQPVTYSPCEPIAVVVNDALAPNGTEGVVEEALQEVSRLTGLRFEDRGRTDEQPGSRRRPGDASLIAWTTPEVVPRLGGATAGLGGSTSISINSEERYVAGEVSLDAPQLARILSRPEGRAQVRAIVLHEVGHLVGLGHVDDPNQLMHRESIGVLEFADGDRRGLALLGSGPCLR